MTMNIYPYGHEIEKVLGNDRANSSKVDVIFDRYTSLQSPSERDAFVLALVAGLLTIRARLSAEAKCMTDRADQVILVERNM
jgi:hypothetical protein